MLEPSNSNKNAALEARRQAACPRGVGVQTQVFVARAQNAELWDVSGKRFIDFGSGIAVLATGHRHPQVVEAVRAQLDAFHHTCFQVTPYEGYVALCERLNAITPGAFAKKTALFTTGVEAVENAVKVAKAATGRNAVIAFSGAFHGRTLMGLALTGKVNPYKAGFGAMPPDVWHVPFPAEALGVSVDDSLQAIDRLFKTDVDPRRVAALIIEPVQGEGGFYVAPLKLFQSLRAVCDEHGILLIVDEVQTGFGRTGKMFALEHYGVDADLITMAKSLAGGFPLSALTGRATVMDAVAPGGLGGTYAGNPIAVAAALAVLDIMQKEALVQRAQALGERLLAHLEPLRARVPQIAQVRALGGMVAMEFRDSSSGVALPEFAKRIQDIALEKGLLLLTCGVYGNVIRFLFPLTIQDAVFAEGLALLSDSLLQA
ncbi:4-aminobutyrate--2-oxoglutarate transaminase [Verminephrobacter aporrectodeae subsp. tuberculatae]|uniref:4-aminobutyrate--2-oxoglutarate transaminase n=1 Tax=Verminephrobacter aporrectodeae TaxID=1110389 RepID=UPI0022436864|nr:4-aminobutyrate--2-oxoglutarate transaminase [Verminephrobacter aporrectodeae]MCW8165803.1 4-aminobutyrate--2-oxoglutarate transaminase [Verminephrobacter aporrectodeae subsp. tuberculatae]MCW8169905.1 4-aminobutyrate--2-oxoglutarate transaminase [Verminephrobacter aporrectodeae subsp. tuberculatae]